MTSTTYPYTCPRCKKQTRTTIQRDTNTTPYCPTCYKAIEEADARLGRMVRKLPSGFSLLSSANKWVVVSNEWDGDLLVSSFKDTPEEALGATDIGKDNP